MLFGGAFVFIPATGPLLVMGPLAAWIIGVLEGAAVGGTAGVLAAALTGIGLSSDSVVRYELDVKAGRFLVIVHGVPELIVRARAVLGTTGALELSARDD
jgi:hypothetical protein